MKDDILSWRSPKLKEGKLYLGVGVMGLLLFSTLACFMQYPAWRKARAARQWPAVPCVVLETGIQKTSQRHENTYSPVVVYEYEFRGQSYRSKRTHLETMEPEDLAGSKTFLESFAVGKVTTCYVNPFDPQEAVLDRSYSVLTSAGFILIMLALGCFLVLYGATKIAQGRRGMVPVHAAEPELPEPAAKAPSEALTLSPPEAGWGGRVLGIILMAGSSGVLYWIASNCLQTRRLVGEFDVSALQFIGGMFAFVVFCAGVVLCWKSFDPFPVVELTPGSPKLGERLEVKWNFCGPIWRLRTLSIWLEGREETMVEDKAPGEFISQPTEKPMSEFFICQRLAAPEEFAQKVSGTVSAQLPLRLMPTFAGEKTNIVWVVRFEGAIAWSLNMKHEFVVKVLPADAELFTTNSLQNPAIPA